MRTTKNLIYSTFIGLRVRIVKSTQRDLIGVEGKVVNETKNLIVIEKDDSVIKIPKISSHFEFETDTREKKIIEGSKILYRPYERPKKVS